MLNACSSSDDGGRADAAEKPQITLEDYAGSQSCKECHATAFEAWANSNHALAERSIDPTLDGTAFDHSELFTQTSSPTRLSWDDDGPKFTSTGVDNVSTELRPVRVLGHDPLRQFLFETAPGRLQANEMAYDPHNDQWFNVFADENRVAGEWGHWTGRGMNWNSMCATCHNTHLRKNYDPASDTYNTTMAEVGVSCESCHGPLKAHVDWQHRHPASAEPDPTTADRDSVKMMDNCGSCHARRTEITGEFVPGEPFADHYLLTVPDHSDLYFPDGQVSAEDYVFTSFLGSKMHAAGVTCQDCHDPHSIRTILPGNELCMRCHSGGREDTPIINPLSHTFHNPTSEGSQCVGCHMPQTTYMQRHPRRDHGFTIPDPRLTVETGTPNACNRCHSDQTTDWAVEHVEQWYGERMNRSTRARALLIHAARQNDETVKQQLIDFLSEEPQPVWQATATRLLDQWLGDPAANKALTRALTNASPLVRAHAASSLDSLAQVDPEIRTRITPLLGDESRSVRTMAAWTLRATLDTQSDAAKELQDILDHGSDQPTGLLKKGYYSIARGNIPEAVELMKKATEWDPNSPPLHQELAVAYSINGDLNAAIRSMKRAIELEPNEAEFHYRLALALSETGDARQTITELRKAVELAPGHARAWYNLGIALQQNGESEAAIAALGRGETASPNDSRIPYARATIHLQTGQTEAARDAAIRALEIQPDFPQARELLRSIGY